MSVGASGTGASAKRDEIATDIGQLNTQKYYKVVLTGGEFV